MNRAGYNKSFWERQSFPEGNNNKEISTFDVIIIGGGITGITLANELQKNGKKCLIIEKEHPGFGTTGRTTAHINNFFDSSYDEIISNFGEDNAKVLAEAAKETLRYIKANIQRYRISCDYSECNFYLFSSEKSQNEKLCKILKAHHKVGIKTNRTYHVPFTIPYKKALEIHGQAHFHPIKYLNRLGKEYLNNGGTILNFSQVTECKSHRDLVIVKTAEGKIFECKKAVWAVHNAPGNSRFNLLISPYRSYALSVKLSEAPSQMGQAADLEDPYHYFRYHKTGKNYYVIAGGFDHKTGHLTDTCSRFRELEEYIRERFCIEKIENMWSAQYYIPADGMPYIGKMPGEENIYISTGYNGNGMTFGTMASLIIPQLMAGIETPLSKMLSPSRINLLASAKNVITENADIFFQIIKNGLEAEKNPNLQTLKKDEGKLADIDGKACAVYRDRKGQLHFLESKCTHMGCTVQWNTTEKSWDCPCHGSRFNAMGKVITGPAVKDLKKIDIEQKITNYGKS